jgi:hypothetical protein
MKLANHLAPAVAASVVALIVLLAAPPIPTARAFTIWVLLLAAIFLAAFAGRVRGAAGPRGRGRFEAALHRKSTAPSPPVELLRMERQLELGIASALHADRRLLPLLRTAAAARLGARHGVELERRPEAAREVLGEDVWELLRPDRPKPEDRHGPGVPRARIERVIERLESL